MLVRPYQPSDYDHMVALYKQSELYGGQYDKDRDSADRLSKRIEADEQAILVVEDGGKIVGTVSLIEDVRTAWLFRYAALTEEAARALVDRASEVLRQRGHHQVIVYSPFGDRLLDKRYDDLGFIKGNDYTCYFKEI